MRLVKYPGCKDKEMGRLMQFVPDGIVRFFDPFCGAGAPYFAIEAESWHLSDLSGDLVNLWHRAMDHDDDFRTWMGVFADVWLQSGNVLEHGHVGCDLRDVYVSYRDGVVMDDDLDEKIDFIVDAHAHELVYIDRLGGRFASDAFTDEVKAQCSKRFRRMRELNFSKKVIDDKDIDANIVGCFKKCVYLRIRELYNSHGDMTAYRAVLFYLIRDLCFSSMFRFANGRFNVPYGGDSYNKKDFSGTADELFALFSDERRAHTEVRQSDWLLAMPSDLGADDFVFVDPPYDGGFSQYDGADFDRFDQRFLAAWLVNKCKARFMLVVRVTDLMSELYVDGTECANGDVLHVSYFDKKYTVSFMDRNDREAVHMVVTNYRPQHDDEEGGA